MHNGIHGVICTRTRLRTSGACFRPGAHIHV
jgi:hypothetical protein